MPWQTCPCRWTDRRWLRRLAAIVRHGRRTWHSCTEPVYHGGPCRCRCGSHLPALSRHTRRTT